MAIQGEVPKFISKIQDVSIDPLLTFGTTLRKNLHNCAKSNNLWIIKNKQSGEKFCAACNHNRTLSYILSCDLDTEENINLPGLANAEVQRQKRTAEQFSYIHSEAAENSEEDFPSDTTEPYDDQQIYVIESASEDSDISSEEEYASVKNDNNNNNNIKKKEKNTLKNLATVAFETERSVCSNCKINICTKSMLSKHYTCCVCYMRLKGKIISTEFFCHLCNEDVSRHTKFGYSVGQVCASKIAAIIAFYEHLKQLFYWIDKNKTNKHLDFSELKKHYDKIMKSSGKLTNHIKIKEDFF